jgi:hypothetical protein
MHHASMPGRSFPVSLVWRAAVIGALAAQPFALIVWIGAEHGGRGLMTFPWAGLWGSLIGTFLSIVFVAVRGLYRAIVRARTA